MFICSNIKILVLAQISIAKMDTPTQSPCVTPTKEKGEPKTPGAPFKDPVFATRLNADDNVGGNAGVKRGRNFEEEFNSVSKEPKP
jgi:hypothetical protein